MADEHLDTSSLRAATGLDSGARRLILGVVWELTGLSSKEMAVLFFRDRFGDVEDYVAAVVQVWGQDIGFRLRQAIGSAQADAQFSYGFGEPPDPIEEAAKAMLLKCPEPDFRTAVEATLGAAKKSGAAAARISAICRHRGVPWSFSAEGGFEYIGDEEVEQLLVRPALAAVNRPEFSGGVRQEFEAARMELAKGTPGDLKQAVHEAGCSIESAMKVVLDAHGVQYSKGATAKPLFDALEAANLTPRHMENLILVAMTPRNRRGGHGAGAQPHQVQGREGEAIVAGASGAIAYLATLLP